MTICISPMSCEKWPWKLMPQRLHININTQTACISSWLEHTRDRNYLTSSWSNPPVSTAALFPSSWSWSWGLSSQLLAWPCWKLNTGSGGCRVRANRQASRRGRWNRGKFQSRVTEHKTLLSTPCQDTRGMEAGEAKMQKVAPEPASEQVTRGHRQTRNSEAELSQRCRLEEMGQDQSHTQGSQPGPATNERSVL